MKVNYPLHVMVLAATYVCALPLAAVAAEAPAAGPPAAPLSPAAVVNMVNNCYTCHGTDGRSPGSIPSLTGKNADQVLLMLKEYKSGRLASTVMTRQAKGYTDAELEAMAKYIADNLK
ncbi:MAG: c-type cytochrome [Gammaproteobacteria bacterium]|nr:c-type cytochrome [Alphaproteobacteria bacterium]MDH3407690.1 c-type cytochrome [Gammaproteobacteria bacterium]